MLALVGSNAAISESNPFFIGAELEAKMTVPGGGSRTTRVPPCTPLRLADDDNGRGKNASVTFGPWRDLVLKRRLLETGERFDDFATCVAATAEYEGRTTEEQVALILNRNIAVDMPLEFALIVLGPNRPRPSGAGGPGQSEYTWYVGDRMGATCAPPTMQSVPNVALRQAPPGPLRIAASTQDGRIVDIQIVASSAKLHGDRVSFNEGMRVYEAGDKPAAFQVWLTLAEKGFVPAQYSVADMYYRGDGVEQQLAQSVTWFRSAAEGGYPPAMYHLAFLHATGEGVQRDLTTAYRWMKRAAAFGSRDGQAGLQMLEDRMTPEQIAESELTSEEWLITNPELVEYARPEYPELAKVARLESDVVLQAKILTDGTIGDVEVLSVSRPNLCFEEAAMAALRQWRYKPAMMRGIPVEVYFTVFVEFKLQ
jgi:TonB family protein